MEELIRGAEADIILGRWLGVPAIFKVRKRRPYIHEELDRRTRSARTIHEAELLVEAKKLGVPAPLVYHVDTKAFTIVMQYLPGPRLKELLGATDHRLDLCHVMGSYMARLHLGGVVHGDPTTSNFIYSNDRLAVIDFGLAHRSALVEDAAVDLHLVREAMSSAHAGVGKSALEAFKLGYSTEAGSKNAEKIWSRVADIERRGRYARSKWGE